MEIKTQKEIYYDLINSEKRWVSVDSLVPKLKNIHFKLEKETYEEYALLQLLKELGDKE